jgi:cell division protein FtsB
MRLDHVKAEIARLRVQIRRQHRDIDNLQRANIDTRAAIALLTRMQDQVDGLIGERNRLSAEVGALLPTYRSGKNIRGTPSARRA